MSMSTTTIPVTPGVYGSNPALHSKSRISSEQSREGPRRTITIKCQWNCQDKAVKEPVPVVTEFA
jgi:hypothetical protein